MFKFPLLPPSLISLLNPNHIQYIYLATWQDPVFKNIWHGIFETDDQHAIEHNWLIELAFLSRVLLELGCIDPSHSQVAGEPLGQGASRHWQIWRHNRKKQSALLTPHRRNLGYAGIDLFHFQIVNFFICLNQGKLTLFKYSLRVLTGHRLGSSSKQGIWKNPRTLDKLDTENERVRSLEYEWGVTYHENVSSMWAEALYKNYHEIQHRSSTPSRCLSWIE